MEYWGLIWCCSRNFYFSENFMAIYFEKPFLRVSTFYPFLKKFKRSFVVKYGLLYLQSGQICIVYRRIITEFSAASLCINLLHCSVLT